MIKNKAPLLPLINKGKIDLKVRVTIIASVAGYFSSLLMEALKYPTGEVYNGIDVLVVGFLSLITSGEVRWLANPLFWILLLFFRENSLSVKIIAILASSLAIASVVFPIYLFTGDTGGPVGRVQAILGMGAYIWSFSIVLGCVCFFINAHNNKTVR